MYFILVASSSIQSCGMFASQKLIQEVKTNVNLTVIEMKNILINELKKLVPVLQITNSK